MKRFEGKLILVVDDETSITELISEELVDEGATTLQAGNAFEAVVQLQTNAVDVIVSDIRMLGGDGVTLLDQIRKVDPSRPPLIFITGFSDLSTQDTYGKGAEAVIAKPFEFEDLKDKVFHLLLPPAERYGKASEAKPSIQIQQEYADIQDALDQKKLRLGRGGFFLAGDPGAKVNSTVGFKITFAAEKATLLEGEGIVRWSRGENHKEGSPGAGVEIVYLTDESRKSFLHYLTHMREISFIPVGFV